MNDNEQMTIEQAIKEAYMNSQVKGFYDEKPSIVRSLTLIICELCEAIEADRKDNRAYCNIDESKIYIIDKINDENFKFIYIDSIKDTVEAELADACIRIFDLCGYIGFYNPKIESLKMPFDDFISNISEIIIVISSAIDHTRFYGKIKEVALIYLENALSLIFSLAEKEKIDLWKYIKLTMRHNRLREYLHSKKY